MRIRTSSARRVVVIVSFAAIAAAAACTNRVESTPDVPEKTAEALRHERRQPVRVVIEAALAHGDLTAEQQAAILAIRDRVDAEQQDRHVIKERLRSSASELVRSGSDDVEQLSAAMDEAMGAIEQRMSITSNALIEVHALLLPEQRTAVAAELRNRIAERYERRARRAGKHERFKKVASYLMLSDAQLEELKRLRKQLIGEHKDLRPSREELEALVAAFERDDFADVLMSFQDGKLVLLRARTAHVAGQANEALSLLTSEQRSLLADLIEVGPEAVGLNER